MGAGGLDRIKIPTCMKKIMSGKQEYISYRSYIPIHTTPPPPRACKTREQLLEYLWQLCSEISPSANTLKSC